MTAHSHIGASSSHRWMACPGSVNLSQGMARASSAFAMEGTAAHRLAEMCLRDGLPAEDFNGVNIIVEGHGFQVDEGMVDAVQVYLDAIAADRRPGDVMVIEERFDLGLFHQGLFGTNDCSLYRPDTGELILYDYKHGRGVAVEAVGNPQLLYYGLGAATSVPGRRLTTIDLVVVQPRCPHPKGSVRRWRTDAMDLLGWSADLVDAAQATEAPDAPIQAGHHCKFCPAEAICPAFYSLVLATAQAEFSDTGDLTTRPPASLSADDMQRVLRHADLIDEWLLSVREYAHHEAEAGRVPTGFKLVNKRAMRSWAEGADVVSFLETIGLTPGEYYKPLDVKSPPQIETVLAKRKLDKKAIAPLVVSKSSGTNLVAVTNARIEAKPSAIADFQPVE